MPDEREPVATVPTRSSPAKGAGAGAGAAGLTGCEGARTGCALRARAGRGAGFFFATFFLTGGVFLRASGFLAGVFRRLGLAFFLVAICIPRSDLSVPEPRSAIAYSIPLTALQLAYKLYIMFI